MEQNKQGVNQGVNQTNSTGQRPAGFVPPRPPQGPPVGPPQQVKKPVVQPAGPAQPTLTEENKKEKKQPKEKKERKQLTKKQCIIIISSVLAVVIATIIILLLLNRETPVDVALKEGTVLEFIDDNNNYYIQASPQQPDVTYVYEIKIDDNTTVILKSNDNTLDITQLITNPQVYSARLYIEKNGKQSHKTEWFNYNNYLTLEAPVLSFDSEENTLEWQAVEHAKSYKIFYSQEDEVLAHIFTPTINEESIGRVEFDLSTLNLPLGTYVFRVVAMPDVANAFHKQSEASNSVTYKNLDKKTAPLSATYNLMTKEIQIDASNLTVLEEFTIIFESFNYTFTPAVKHDVYVIDISAITQNEIGSGQEIFVKVNSHNENILESDLIQVSFIN